jgi:uncharacterized membrane protein YfcA
MDLTLLYMIAIGFFAQLIDGSLGMAYGVTANSFLLAFGLSPAAASASVHASEIVTTCVSGLCHWKFGNIDKRLVWRLLLPGVIGGSLGAYILTSLDGNVIKPYITVYLLLMGLRILYKAYRPTPNQEVKIKTPLLAGLGLAGGFCDAIGGGGWGPVVTTTLISTGNSPQKSIGSVNFSEFFVTLAESVVFILTIGLTHYQVILCLLLGGVIAAPIAARLTNKLPTRLIMVLVGCLIVFLQGRTLYLMVA